MEKKGWMSCYSADWHHVMLMLLWFPTALSSRSPTWPAFLHCQRHGSQCPSWWPCQPRRNTLELSPVQEDKVQTSVSAFWWLTNIRAWDELRCRGLHVTLKGKSCDARQSIFGKVDAGEAFKDSCCHRFQLWYWGSAAAWSDVLAAGCKWRSFLKSHGIRAKEQLSIASLVVPHNC